MQLILRASEGQWTHINVSAKNSSFILPSKLRLHKIVCEFSRSACFRCMFLEIWLIFIK